MAKVQSKSHGESVSARMVLLRLSLLLVGLCLAASAQEPFCPNTPVGDLDVVRLESKVFGNARMLRVLLPPGYRLAKYSTLHYSVL